LNKLGHFKVALFSLVISSIIETTQIITKFGVFDIDDILLSIVGASLGFMIYRIYKNKKETF
jgi:glycopeptide antibiotics resistance protein